MQFNVRQSSAQYTCSEIGCSKPIYYRIHGYLCIKHYYQQQNGIPPALRKEQPPYYRAEPRTDNDLVRFIIATEAEAIARGRVERVRFGSLQPEYIRYWHPV